MFPSMAPPELEVVYGWEFAYGFEGCKKCYYDKKINNIELKSFFPPIFNTFDRLQKNYFNGKNSKLIDNSIEDGVIVADYEKIIKTITKFFCKFIEMHICYAKLSYQ